MKQTVTESIFITAVRAYDRVNQFGIDGWRALFEYIEELERDIGEEYEMDIIALCCDWTRYESIDEFNREQGEECADLDDVVDNTQVIPLEGGAFLAMNY